MHPYRSLCRIGLFHCQPLTALKHCQPINSKCYISVDRQPPRSFLLLNSTSSQGPFLLSKAPVFQTQCPLASDIHKRFKKTKSRGKNINADDNEEDGEDDDDDDDAGEENPLLVEDSINADADGAEVATLDVGSLRLDAFGKHGLGMSRAKIEEAIYKGDIYVNGERPRKKSCDLKEGDEVDFVKGRNAEDHTMIDIRRVQIVKVPDKTSEFGRMKVKVKKWQKLTVSDYTSKSNDYDS